MYRKKDKLWVKWIHSYYGNGRIIWEANSNQASWMVQKIFKAKKYFEEAGTFMELQSMAEFSIKKMYKKMLGTFTKVSWRRLICNNHGSPKWLFIVRLVVLGRLYTKDRLQK